VLRASEFSIVPQAPPLIGTPSACYFKKQNMKIALHVLFFIYCKSFYDLFDPAFMLLVFLVIIDPNKKKLSAECLQLFRIVPILYLTCEWSSLPLPSRRLRYN
jgi:hypothetical protein